MCGICGAYNYLNKTPIEQSLLKRMNDALYARGPDDEGYFIKGYIGLANKRLSIMDVEGGKQPIFNEDGKICIVFNGEIYNYIELKKELEAKGHTFKTKTDTEVIVHLYEEHGDDCVKFLRGMFAFAIWDSKEDKLLLARDRFGIKPLVYSDRNGRLVFASETKAIVQDKNISRDIDFEAVHYYLTYLSVPSPLTIYKGIKKLPTASILICQGGKIIEKRYWSLKPNKLKLNSIEEYGDIFYKLLKDSVKMRLMSDVPLGAFLSGGIDSSSVVGFMSQLSSRPVKTFSIGFKEQEFDELKHARFIAKRFNTEHYELIMMPKDIGRIEDLIWNLDEPHADSSALASYLVSKLAAPNIKVALSGVGGDELFGGYHSYIADKLSIYYSVLPKILTQGVIANLVSHIKVDTQNPSKARRILRFLKSAHLPFNERHTNWMTLLGFNEEEKSELYSDFLKKQTDGLCSFFVTKEYFDKGKIIGLDYLNTAMFIDLNTYLNNDVLQQVDRMTMANSLEARVPFLDHKLVEFAFAIPSDLKLKGLSLKYLLKKSMKGLLTDEVVNRQKHGFGVPIREWFKSDLIRKSTDEFLNDSSVKRRGFFKVEYVKRIVNDHAKGKADNSHKLWLIMILEIWCRRFLDN
ncbi:MAG: asparagine synthase (glutamine-hydrolyzing) [Candidatus Omnitrophica bacterium]|nr:asparagine synthase (glutamine-hydrolyzing) [Candidatus Omnitrophota bacterium]